MTRLNRLQRTTLRAAQHPLNAVALAAGLGGAIAMDNLLPLAFYALVFGVGALAVWNWDLFGAEIDAEEVAVSRQGAEQRRSELAASLADGLEQLRLHGFGQVRPLLQEYVDLCNARDEIARLAKERSEVNLTSEFEIVRRVEGLLDMYLALARKHLTYVGLLAGVRLVPRLEKHARTEAASTRAVPRLRDRLGELDRQRQMLADAIAALPENSSTREGKAHQLRALDERRRVLLEASRSHDGVLAELDSIRVFFAAVLERLGAAELVAADVSEYVETSVAELDRTYALRHCSM